MRYVVASLYRVEDVTSSYFPSVLYSHVSISYILLMTASQQSQASLRTYFSLPVRRSVYLNLFSAAFQLITSQMALKYSAFLFSYCKLRLVSIHPPLCILNMILTSKHAPKHPPPTTA